MKKVLGLLIVLLQCASAPALAQRTSVSAAFPIYNNTGRPDLTIDPQRFVSQMSIVDRLFDDPNDCVFQEGLIGDFGVRRLLRFDMVIINAGDGDLLVGDRSDPGNPYADWFVFSPCHGHYHISGFASYELLNLDGTVAQGRKQSFCFEDSFKYGGGKSHGYDCGFQGITSGWGDWYYKQLDGQWIDITGVPKGDYIVRAEINAAGTFDEGENRYPNVVETVIHVPDPRNKVSGP